jgi:hypothetical protein
VSTLLLTVAENYQEHSRLSASNCGYILYDPHAQVTSDKPVVVERTMKFVNRQGIHQAMGIR